MDTSAQAPRADGPVAVIDIGPLRDGTDPHGVAKALYHASHDMDAARMQDKEQPDRKEPFIWGHEDDDGRVPADHPLRGANRWPASLPALRTAADAPIRCGDYLQWRFGQSFAYRTDAAPTLAATP